MSQSGRLSRLEGMNTSKTTSGKGRLRVLIVGGGFAGAAAAVRLAGRAGDHVAVTLVNPRTDFVNRLRMHHVAVGKKIPVPNLPRMLGSKVGFLEGYVSDLDPDAGRAAVSTPDGVLSVPFDRVILATGSTTERAPIPGGEHVHGLADIDAARALRPRLAEVRAGSSVTVVGGGLTGLETVAEIAENRPDLHVRLTTSGTVGGWFQPRTAEYVRETLRGLGVELLDDVRVAAAEPDRLLLHDGSEVPSALTVWCGGFAAPALARQSGLAVDDQGAVMTDAALRSLSHPAVLAVGDSGHTPGPGGERYSMSCQFAYPSGAHAADVIRAEALGRPVETLGSPGGDVSTAFDFGFIARCVGLGSRAAVLQLTDGDDTATGRALTGRAGAMVKRFQLAVITRAVGAERMMPGTIRWPKGHREAARDAAVVAG